MKRLVIPVLFLLQLAHLILFPSSIENLDGEISIEWPEMWYRIGVVLIGNALALAIWAKAISRLEMFVAGGFSVGVWVLSISTVEYFIYLILDGTVYTESAGVAWDYTALQCLVFLSVGWLTWFLTRRRALRSMSRKENPC